MTGSEDSDFADIVLLSDDPSAADEFTGKAHEHVAIALAHLIQGEAGGRVIGLEGSWGSGKSTIVRLLREQLEASHSEKRSSDSETRVVVFDAWSHQSDPLRRAFLDTLIDRLAAVDWLNKSTADEFRKKLSGKTRTTDTRSTPRLSWEGRFAAVSAVLLPLGIALFTNHFNQYHRAAQIIGLGLLVAPILVVVASFLLKGIGVTAGGKKHSEDSKSRKRRLADLRPFDFFARVQSAVTTTMESVEGADPTSVEFERLFSKVLQAGLLEKRRLLIVLDNLDRVDEADARTVLATMQTFTGARNVLPPPLAERVWTLIPYDPTGFDRLWNLDDGTDGETARSTGTGEETPASLGAAFIEKLFQAHFETPPLVLSDWREYLAGLLRTAIPSIQDADVSRILSLRAQYVGRLLSRESPTPRQLKQFVNDVALLSARRGDIPLVNIAYYVLLRRDRCIVADGLRAGTIPADRLVPIFGSDIRSDLAALHYGTTRELGQQLLLGGQLDRAFEIGDTDAVTRLMDIPGFVDALELEDVHSGVANGGIGITRMVGTLEAAGALDRPDVVGWYERGLQPVARYATNWILSGSDTGAGMATLFSDLSPGNDTLLSELLARLEPSASEADGDGRLQLEGAAALCTGLSRRGRVDPAIEVRLNIPSERLVTTLASFHRLTEAEPNARQLLAPTAQPDEVAGPLAQAATGDAFGPVNSAFDVLLTRPARVDLKAVATSLLAWLKENDPVSGKQLEAQLSMLDKARRYGAVEPTITAAAEEGTFMHLVAVANDEAAYSLIAAASMLSLIALPSLPPAPATVPQRRIAEGTNLIESALKDPAAQPEITAAQQDWLVSHPSEAFGILVRLAQQLADSAPWVKHQLQELGRSSQLRVSATEYKQQWKYLKSVLGDDSFARLSIAVLSDDDARHDLLSGADDPELANELLDRIDAGAPFFQEVATWASDVLKRTTREIWDRGLANPDGGPSLALATRLSGTADAPSDPPNLDDALQAHFELLAKGEEAWRPEASTFDKVAALLSAATRTVLAERLCTALADHLEGIGDGVFTTYGNFLGQEAAFRTHEKLPLIAERLVAHDDWASVTWLDGLAEHFPDTLEPANRENNIAFLKRKVGDKLGETEDPPPALIRLAARLGVELPEEDEPRAVEDPTSS